MSLRARVVALIGLILILGVLLGSLSAGYAARRTLAEELSAAMTGGEQTVRGAFEDLPRSDHAERDLRQLVATFDGDRHLDAALVDARGRTLSRSSRQTVFAPAPAWFERLLGVEAGPPWTAAPPGSPDRRVVLTPVPALDVSALWSEFRGVVAALSLSALAGLLLVYLAIGAALRPLRDLSEAFVRIGAGDYQARVGARGPAELRDLQAGFNAMGEQLAVMSGRNRTLEAQLVTLQDEERADLARDLHDEIGPHLFAVNVDAAVAGRLIGSQRSAEAMTNIGSIQASVGHMQRLVRDILGRLRPSRATELGLNAAILDLVAFWQARAPAIVIECQLLDDETLLDEPLKDTVYRVVQESLNNAVRHAAATRIAARVGLAGSGAIEVRVADNGTAAAATTKGGGFGIVGMRERVRGSGGALDIDRNGTLGGWTVTASLPLRPVAVAAGADP